MSLILGLALVCGVRCAVCGVQRESGPIKRLSTMCEGFCWGFNFLHKIACTYTHRWNPMLALLQAAGHLLVGYVLLPCLAFCGAFAS